MSYDQPINILFMARKFPPSVGGMERFADDLYEALSTKTNLKLIKWGGSNKFLPIVLPVFFIRASWALLTKKINIIHLQDGLQAPIGVVLKFIFKKPLCVVIHGLDITYQNGLYQTIIPKSLQKADHIFCISHAAMDEVLKRGIDKSKVSFIPLGVTDDLNLPGKEAARKRLLQSLKAEESSKIIMSAGRLIKRKGVEWFVSNVLPELVKMDDQTIFAVSGEGPERPAIERTIKELNLQNNVRLLGRTSDKFLADLYNGSNLFVMPNIVVPGDMEGFGRVLLEASLCELPIVASDIEGITDAITNNKNGVLVKANDPAAFISSVTKFLSGKNKAISYGQKSRKYTLQKFGWEKIAGQYLSQYQKLLT